MGVLSRPLQITHVAALQGLRALGWRPRTVYDIGAFRGDWSREAAKIFPSAEFILFEANSDRENELKRSGHRYFISALSATENVEAPFYIAKGVLPSGASLYRENSPYYAGPNVAVRTIATRRLDSLVAEYGLPLPDLVKIDTQGSELDVIAGGTHALSQCAVLIVEASLLNFNAGAPLFAEVVAAITKLGLKCVDLCDAHNVEAGYIIQLDLMFVNDALYRKYYAAAGLV